MRVPVAITGFGVVSPLGPNAAAFFDGLQTARSGIVADEEGARFGVPQLGRIGDFGANERIAASSRRRMPRLTQLAYVAAKEALGEAQPTAVPERSGIVLGTGLGAVRETIEFVRGYLRGGPEGASPMLFPATVMNAAAGQLAIELGFRGPNSTVNHREYSPLGALSLACDFLALGRADIMLVGAMDEASEPMLHGYQNLAQVSPTVVRPYDRARDGLVPGEAAVMFALERVDDARARGKRCLALVSELCESSDQRPRIGYGKSDQYVAAEAAVRSIAKRPDVIVGGGNGTALDEHELSLLGRCFGEDLPPISSITGQVGDSMAAAFLRLGAGLFALERQELPGTYGLEQPIAHSRALSTKNRCLRVDNFLLPLFSQGGANAVALLEKA